MDIDKIAEILKNGGHLVMHKNDLERLRESDEAGNKPEIFKGVKILRDQTGIIAEGEVFAVRHGYHREEFSFREPFNT